MDTECVDELGATWAILIDDKRSRWRRKEKRKKVTVETNNLKGSPAQNESRRLLVDTNDHGTTRSNDSA
jgi:hypothetical protein